MSPTFLGVTERQRLANRVVAELYDIRMGADGRLGFLELAGLQQFASGLNLASNARTFAGRLVSTVERYGSLPQRPEYHALGALICYVLDLDETPEDAAFLAQLIVKYSLVADLDYISDLRTRYGIQVQPTREAESDFMAPPQRPVIQQEPPFEPRVGDQESLERIINSEDNFLDVQLLAGAIYSAQAVGRVELPEGTALGTGFLVAPNLLLTNQHVLKAQEYLQEAVVRFDYHVDATGVVNRGRVFEFDPNFYRSSPDTQLDYALVRLNEEPLGHMSMQPSGEDYSPLDLLRRGSHRGYLLLAPRMILERQRINIIQHPDGDPQKVVLTQNYVVSDTIENRVHYLADTMPGSPVFNKKWEVIAIHHSGGPHPPEPLSGSLKRALKGHFRINEGIPMRVILPEIQRYLGT